MSTTYRQLVLRLPDGLKETMRERVAADAGMEGVDFTPEKKGSRRFTFTMDGKKYPARLVDMPCVLETQKTLDKRTFFKSGDVGQMLIVYKDENAYKKDDGNASGVGPQRLYPDGLTPPTKNIVRRRFVKARPDRGKFDRAEVIRVESQVLKMQQDVPEGPDRSRKAGSSGGGGITAGGGMSGSSSRGGSADASGGGSSSSRSRTSRSSGGGGGSSGGGGGGGGEVGGDGVTFEHEEIVPFEPWMADPKFAALGRLEGITLEVTGTTEKPEAGAAGAAGGAGGGEGSTAPRLFGSELLYEHPEILLAVSDTPEDPTLQPPRPAKPATPTTTPGSSPGGSGKKSSSAAGGGAKKKQQQQQQQQQQKQKQKQKQQAARGGGSAGGGGGGGRGQQRQQVTLPSVGVPAAMPSLGEGVGLDPDDASAVMEDMNDAEDVLGVEDIFLGM